MVFEELIIGSVETGRVMGHACTHTHTCVHTHAHICRHMSKTVVGAYFQRSGKLHCCINKSFGWLAV